MEKFRKIIRTANQVGVVVLIVMVLVALLQIQFGYRVDKVQKLVIGWLFFKLVSIYAIEWFLKNFK